jgi:hypothetical protein
MTENEQKADLIKKGLAIVDELAKLDVDDIDELIDLIERAEKLKKDRLWKLK